jgi:hypothetical protein
VQTDEVQVALRPRSGLEAIDLGFRMARAWWRPLAATWLALVVPIGAAITIALRDHPFWAVALLWWLRPVYDRVPLHVLGGRFFGAPTGLADTVRALPGLLRSGLGTSLFLQRLSPARTFLLPVLQLEGLRGAGRRQRCATLARRDGGSAAALVAAAAHCTGAIALGLLLLAEALVPEELAWDVFERFSPLAEDAADDPGLILIPALYFTAVSVVEPLLVASGFALYVSRRLYLEGWDIELAFRRLGAERRAAARAAAALLLGAVLAVPGAARAEESPCVGNEPLSAGSCIADVLADPDFGSVEKQLRWVPREQDSQEWSLPGLDWLPGVLAAGLRIAAWLALAACVVAIVLALLRIQAPAPRGPPPTLPAILFGLAVDPRTLPDDVVTAARAAWARGAAIEALSLLYRGALVRLMAGGALAIPASATELECVRLVERSQAPERARTFAALTQAWIGARYAHRPPAEHDFDALCAGFGPAFGAEA